LRMARTPRIIALVTIGRKTMHITVNGKKFSAGGRRQSPSVPLGAGRVSRVAVNLRCRFSH